MLFRWFLPPVQVGPTVYVNWDFYNGAMSTDQCMELRAVLEEVHVMPGVKAGASPDQCDPLLISTCRPGPAALLSRPHHLIPPPPSVVLLGSRSFFSNGVHLNVIEAAADPAFESWRNINAIDDVVKASFHMTDKVGSG